MFPIGAPAPDYHFTVLYNGKPVPNATVELDPIEGSNDGKFGNTGSGVSFSNTLTADTGYNPSQTGTTDTSGNVTIAGSTLILGGAYEVSVLPLTFTDSASNKIQTVLTFGPEILAGFGGPANSVVHTINLSNAAPPATGVPLYLANESNPPPNQQLQADGSLVLTFSAPVTLVNPTCFAAAISPGEKNDLSGAGTGAMPVAPATGNGNPQVSASLSADGLTLTLKPLYATQPNATDRNVALAYSNGPPASNVAACGAVAGGTPQGAKIVPKDYPADAFIVFDSTPGAGDGLQPAPSTFGAHADDGVVHVTGP
jgi:hypothetical protein